MKEQKILKEMLYNTLDNYVEVLDHDVYRGVEYYIVNRGSWPCAYINVLKDKKEKVDSLCHGGVSWHDRYIPGIDKAKGKYWLGWDYGHSGDYTVFGLHMTMGKVWHTDEILKEVREVIDCLP